MHSTKMEEQPWRLYHNNTRYSNILARRLKRIAKDDGKSFREIYTASEKPTLTSESIYASGHKDIEAAFFRR